MKACDPGYKHENKHQHHHAKVQWVDAGEPAAQELQICGKHHPGLKPPCIDQGENESAQQEENVNLTSAA